MRLTVADGAGLQGMDQQLLFPYCGNAYTEWDDFQLALREDRIDLSWSTLMESPNTYFEVERSPDPINFRPIDRLDAGKFQYQSSDFTPIHGTNYYRIAVYTETGFSEFSPVLQAEYPLPPALELFPNPTRQLISVRIREIKGEGQLMLSDLQGKTVLLARWQGDRTDFFDQVSVSSLSPGVYLYHLDNGIQSLSGKLIITE